MGVLCGKKDCMTRADPKKVSRVAYVIGALVRANPNPHPNPNPDPIPHQVSRVAYVIGTFAGHPAVMGSMNAFLTWLNKVG